MATATYTTNLVDIVDDTQTASSSNWSALGGGGAALNPGSTELFIEDTQSMTKDAFGQDQKGMIYDTGSDQGGSGTDGAYSFWITFTSIPSLDTKAGQGLEVLIGSATNAYEHYEVFGSDTVPFGGWLFACVNEDTAGDNTTGSPTAGVERTFGVMADATAAGSPSKGETISLDTVREGRHDIVIEYGTGADPEATFDGIMTNLETATNRWGLMVQKEPGGAFENSGLIQFGTSTNAVEFNDESKVIFLRDHDHVTSNFHTWECNHASSVITFTNLVVKALGTTSKGRWVTNDNPTMTWTTCQFVDMGTFSFDSNATIDTCTFLNCGQVTTTGDMQGSNFLESAVAADTGAAYVDAAYTDTYLDGTTFSMGSNSHHAIDFGTSVTSSLTLRNVAFSGFGSTDDANDSTVRFLATSGSLTLSLENCTVDGAAATTSNFSVDDAAGITVTLSIDPVATLVHVNDHNGDDLENARVFLEAKDATGDLPFEETVTSITRSGTTATVSHTGHGLKDNEYINIQGITDKVEDNWGAHQITLDGVDPDNKYSYTTTDSGSTSYTGTIKVTGATIYGLTDSGGDITTSRTYGSDQNLVGYVRKSSSSPRYKTFPLDITVDSANGREVSVQLIIDE